MMEQQKSLRTSNDPSKTCRGIILHALAASMFIVVAGPASYAQEAEMPGHELPINDPDDILAVCGGDPAAGEPNFAQTCAACHTLEEGAPHGVGPNLYALYGRTAGSAEGYQYSAAMQQAGANGLVWGRNTLTPFFEDPQSVVPGTTKQPMPGMQNLIYRTDLMTYVRLNTTPPPPAVEDVTVPAELAAMQGDPAYGEFLASECASCHVSGRAASSGVPQIDNLSPEDMMLALVQYRLGARDNTTMVSIAQNLGDLEIASLVAYFAQLKD